MALRAHTPIHENRALPLRAALFRTLAIVTLAATTCAGCAENPSSSPASPPVMVQQKLVMRPVPVKTAPNIIPVVQTVELYEPARHRFVASATMPDGRAFHTATLFTAGSVSRVLILGGISASGATAQSLEFYDASGDSISVENADPLSGREAHVASALPSGQILVAGGMSVALHRKETYDRTTGRFEVSYSRAGIMPAAATPLALLPRGIALWGEALSSAYLYDPAGGTTPSVQSMGQARLLATATTLADGRILIAGGLDAKGASLATAEIFDPSTGEFTKTGRMSEPRAGAVATLLGSGGVLIAGGMDRGRVMASAEIYNPAFGRFTRVPRMTRARACASATMLTSGARVGQVLIAGGWEKAGGVALSSAEAYNPRTHRFVHIGEMSSPRAEHTATALNSGEVLFAGGMDSPGHVLRTAELYDPSADRFIAIDGMGAPRVGHTATLLPDGRVLIAGGVSGPALNQ